MNRFTYFTFICVANKGAPAEESCQKMVLFLLFLEVFGLHLFRLYFLLAPYPLFVYFLKLFEVIIDIHVV